MTTASKTDQQDAHELRVFLRFSAAAQLAISPDSIRKRQPPEPDIQCGSTPVPHSAGARSCKVLCGGYDLCP
jgi:hypothetical protein